MNCDSLSDLLNDRDLKVVFQEYIYKCKHCDHMKEKFFFDENILKGEYQPSGTYNGSSLNKLWFCCKYGMKLVNF